jgi:ABC-type multidrug transport system ATPase subunit
LQSILSVNNISKSYGPVQALKNVSLEIPEGSVFGILGPNGSGKTTLLGILLDVLNADSGQFQWFGGIPGNDARKQIGSILETPNFYHYLSAADNLEIAASIKRLNNNNKTEVLDKVGLLQRKDSKFQTYSLGMKQRLSIASALLGNPKVLVLDEPTNGLDPAGLAEIRELIKQLNREGITVIMASHLLDEVEKVCTHVAILKKGNLLLQGAVNDVLQSEDQVIVSAPGLTMLNETLKQMPGIRQITPSSDTLRLTCDANITPMDINKFCMSKGIILSQLQMKKKSLETKFMELTGE